MTVANISRTASYVGNGVNVGPFAFGYRVDSAAWIEVTVNSVVQALGIDYTVSRNADQIVSPGGSVTFTIAPGNAIPIDLAGATPIEQVLLDLVQYGDFPAEAQEAALDRLTMMAQERGKISNGGTGEITAQEAIDALTQSMGITAGFVLTVDGSGNSVWVSPPGAGTGGGDLDNGTQLGVGVDVFKEKLGSALTFRSLVALGAASLVENTSDVTIDVSRADIGDTFYPATTQETTASVVPSDNIYPPGDSRRYSNLQDAIDASEGNYKLLLDASSHSITASLVADASLIIEGVGTDYPTGNNGSIIDNTTNDVVALLFDGTGTRIDRARIRDILLTHEAPTRYAIHFDDAPFSDIDNVVVNCNLLGFGGLHFGDALAAPVSGSFLGSVRNARIWRFASVGIRVNSTGTLWVFDHCHVGSTANNAIAGLFEKEGVRVTGGQWGASGNGGGEIGLSDWNGGAGQRQGNVFDGQLFENMTGRCVSFDGLTQSILGGSAKNLTVNLVSVTGTVCYFGRAEQCRIEAPIIDNPGGGGTLVEWSANSDSCVLECNYDAAQAPVTVNASAVRAMKIVTGIIARSQVINITVAANLTTILREGISDTPVGFVPVHNGVAWNYVHLTMTDDTASIAITPPTELGVVTVLSDADALTVGRASYDVRAAGAQCVAWGGTDLEAGTGIPVGTTGTNSKVTVFAHTNGSIYIEARKGAANITLLFESTTFDVP